MASPDRILPDIDTIRFRVGASSGHATSSDPVFGRDYRTVSNRIWWAIHMPFALETEAEYEQMLCRLARKTISNTYYIAMMFLDT